MGEFGASMLLGIGALVVLIIWHRVMRTDTIIGGLLRFGWNGAFLILSIIPGLGWVRMFMYTKDVSQKEEWVRSGEEADRETHSQWEAENRRNEEQMARLQAQREENEREVRRQVYQKTGNGDLQFNSDGSYVRRPGGEWERTSDVMNDL